MRHLDLFSGIGGFALGLRMAGGFETIGFCEIDGYCQRVLKKHWPDVPIYEDVTTLDYEQFIGQVDIITAGFPCQDLSVAGRGAGLAGERSGLYRYLMDALRVVRPRYAIIENVAALLSRGLGVILGDLTEVGYDAEWHCIPASAVGAPHQRDRVWIIAHARSDELWDEPGGRRRPCRASEAEPSDDGTTESVADPHSRRRRADIAGKHDADRQDPGRQEADGLLGKIRQAGRNGTMAHTDSGRREGQNVPVRQPRQDEAAPVARGNGKDMADSDGTRQPDAQRCGAPSQWSGLGAAIERGIRSRADDGWCPEPAIRRVVNGLPHRIHRLRGLGNAVVPQIVGVLGRAILEADHAREV